MATNGVGHDHQGTLSGTFDLPYTLDLACPLPLPSKPLTSTPWPFSVAGPSSVKDEDFPAYVRRRYLESLLLSDLISPIPHFIEDIDRASPEAQVAAIRPLLLSLPEIEKRHRKTILPIFSALVSSASNPTSEVSANIVQTALAESSLSHEEQNVIRVALELRLGCRAADDGAVIAPKKLSVELEKRETLLQVALLFQYIIHVPPAESTKKRKRDKRKSSTKQVYDDPIIALETLVDRLSVWSAVADLGTGPAVEENEDGIQAILRRFWDQVVKPHFLSTQPELCASFHLKVFARPISPTLAPAPLTTKKSRKPAITRARPSSDALTQPESLRPPSRSLSRAPSEVSEIRRRSPSRERSLSRSLSARPDALDMRRSRSNSMDPAKQNEAYAQKKGMMRAPSGKDLFKGRQVGLMRRTSSVVGHKGKARESQSLGLGRTESQARMGLLGRKTSDPKVRRDSMESQNQSQPGTLIFATPSKPRLADSIFGPRLSKFTAPAPIREEPSSIERATFVTETPHGPGRMSKDLGISLIAETPMTSTRDFIPGTGKSYAGMAINALNSVERVEDSGDESDPLADLMVMTDEED